MLTIIGRQIVSHLQANELKTIAIKSIITTSMMKKVNISWLYLRSTQDLATKIQERHQLLQSTRPNLQ